MYDYDYIVMLDENGSPYLEHISLKGAASKVKSAAGSVKNGVGRGVRESHKYIQKVVDGGKTRYFYTKAEWDAYVNGAKTKVKDTASKAADSAKKAVKEASGYAAKERMKDLNQKESRALEDYIDAQNRSNDTMYRQRRRLDNYTEAYGRYYSNRNPFKNRKLINEVSNAGEKLRNTTSALERADDNRKSTQRTYVRARDAAEKNRDKYEHSLAGALDKVGAIARTKISDIQDEIDEARANKIIKENAGVDMRIAKMRATSSTLHINSEDGVKESKYPYLRNASREIVFQAQELRDAYKASTDAKERKEIKRELDKLKKKQANLYK